MYEYIADGITELARSWKADPARPTVAAEIETQYEELVEDWVDDSSVPLLIRKQKKNKGHILKHKTGRLLVPVDNAPANWFLSSALKGKHISLSNILPWLESGQLPVAMIPDKGAIYRGKQKINMDPPNLNTEGWTIRHTAGLELGQREITKMDLPDLQDHMRKFLSPRNMFLIPKEYGGLAECEAFTSVFAEMD
jgi:hypothetical protein